MLAQIYRDSILVKETSCTDTEKQFMESYKGTENMRVNRTQAGWELVAEPGELYDFLYNVSIKFDIELM